MGVDGQRHAPFGILPAQTLYPLYRRLGGFQGWLGRKVENLATTGMRPPDRPVRPVIPANLWWAKLKEKKITWKSLAWMDRRIMRMNIAGGGMYGVEWSGFNWLRTGITGELLWPLINQFSYSMMWEMSLTVKQLLACQEILCSVDYLAG